MRRFREPSIIDFTEAREALARAVGRRRAQLEREKTLGRFAIAPSVEALATSGITVKRAGEVMASLNTAMPKLADLRTPSSAGLFGYDVPEESKLGSYFARRPDEKARPRRKK